MKCVRCEENDAVEDAAAYEYSTGLSRDPDTTHNYPSDLDDHCEDCLDEGLQQMMEESQVSAAEESDEYEGHIRSRRFGG